LWPRTAIVSLDLRANAGNEFVVLDAGGASGGAGEAAEAAVEVADGGGGEGGDAFVNGVHEVDAASGGVVFFADDAVAGAGGQAEAAVDAGIDDRLLGWFGAVEGEGGFLRCGLGVGIEAGVEF